MRIPAMGFCCRKGLMPPVSSMIFGLVPRTASPRLNSLSVIPAENVIAPMPRRENSPSSWERELSSVRSSLIRTRLFRKPKVTVGSV